MKHDYTGFCCDFPPDEWNIHTRPTDQQTSRTNITEALRQALAAHRLNVLDIGVVDHCTSGCAESIARALAAEPRSDAVSRKHDNHDGCSPYDPEHVAAKAGDAVTAREQMQTQIDKRLLTRTERDLRYVGSGAPDEPIVDLPLRVVVDANGAYWRDYGTHYSMCPVSEDNDAIVVLAAYEPREARAASASADYGCDHAAICMCVERGHEQCCGENRREYDRSVAAAEAFNTQGMRLPPSTGDAYAGRAASASVPPLHTDDAGSPLGSTTEGSSFGPMPAGDASGELGLRDASPASAIVTESVTSAVPPLDEERLALHPPDCDCADCTAAYAAETPKLDPEDGLDS